MSSTSHSDSSALITFLVPHDTALAKTDVSWIVGNRAASGFYDGISLVRFAYENPTELTPGSRATRKQLLRRGESEISGLLTNICRCDTFALA
jgi:hypothetical protein